MLCDNCKKREATIHITKYIDDKKSELYLCEKCARETGHLNDNDGFTFQNLITGILNPDLNDLNKIKESSMECNNCGLAYEKFKRNGKMGCAECYSKFENKLRPLMKKIHGSESHIGKVPQSEKNYLDVKKDIEKLKAKMEKVIEDENFERAAQLRDEIYELEKKIGSE